jgi:hypothetical protein
MHPTDTTDLMSEAKTNTLANAKFHYDTNYKVLICEYYRVAVVGLNGHLKDAHNLYRKDERQPILDQYTGLVLVEPCNITTLLLNGLPFEALRKPARVFHYDDCSNILRSQKAIQGHCNRIHR